MEEDKKFFVEYNMINTTNDIEWLEAFSSALLTEEFLVGYLEHLKKKGALDIKVYEKVEVTSHFV